MWSALALLLAACAPEEPLAFCDSGVRHLYDPEAEEILAFPDDIYTVPDADSSTGLRVGAADAPWMTEVPDLLVGFMEGLEGATGFGRLGAAVLRFSSDIGPVPEGAEASVTAPGLQWLDLSVDPPERVPYRATLTDLGRQVILQPLRPLRSGARHAVLLTAEHPAASGRCVAPTRQQRAWLAGEDEDDPMAERYGELLAATGLRGDEVSAALVFTAHDDVYELLAAAEDVRAQTYAWSSRPGCVGGRCENTFEASDYRDPTSRLIGPTPAATWTLPVSTWLPSGDPPFPVVVFGHGIDSGRSEWGGAASKLGDLGFAVVAADALEHRDHPTAADDDTNDALAFLGIDLATFTTDSIGLRGNCDQTVLDRLQLIELIKQDPDVDADGVDDLDPTRLVYVGVSLGGMLGPSLLALSEDLQVAALPVSGGHLMTFATQQESVAALRSLLELMSGGEAELERLLAVAQAAIDPSDPAVWASHVLRDRLVAEDYPPHVLLPVSLVDEAVPAETGRALARGLGVPHLPPVADPVDGLPTSAALPLTANLDGLTAGYFQYDRVTAGDTVVPAAHWNTTWSPEATLQIRTFFSTWLERGQPTLIDPYEALGTPPL
ncbi:MAG: hypothetical protein JRJ84_17665 [Deltaproteobacteria bacterium]|nr:hypothetical protein [Deltaproteobacteria bacterium]